MLRQSYQRLAPQTYTPPQWPVELEAVVYRPRDRQPMPAVLVVHGGSWSARAPSDMNRICRYLAARGYVAVNVAYRLAPQHLFPAALRDLEQALNWMVANAETLAIDPARIGAFGYSAGAHLAALLALTESAAAPRSRPARGYSLRAVIAGGIPADLTKWPQSPVVRRFLGVSFRADPQLWVEASPIAHVSDTAPPFLLYHGGADRLVEADQSRRLHQRLAARGVRADLHIVPYHGHLSMFVLNRSALRRSTAFLADTLGGCLSGG
ncbi:MAG: alpha/beta hydrolase [Gammaproteobacteria bacterium]|nr:alpha/beta hydrolase [Gammaproteobacteria bacterium]